MGEGGDGLFEQSRLNGPARSAILGTAQNRQLFDDELRIERII